MITVTNLSKTYGGTLVLELPELCIPKGQRFGLVGNNGAGKTTFFSLLLDLIERSSGRITINAIDVQSSEEWKPFTAAFIDESYLIGYLTVEEYYYFLGSLRGLSTKEIDEWVLGYETFFNGFILVSRYCFRASSLGNHS